MCKLESSVDHIEKSLDFYTLKDRRKLQENTREKKLYLEMRAG